ncbi:MAG: alkaline phosphatase family protein, partial [Trebonia sp.]
MTDVGTTPAANLLADLILPVPGLYRRHPTRNLGAVAAAIKGAYQGTGPAGLGRGRSLVVIAVDGLGYGHAAHVLNPDSIQALTSEFPTTTVACLLTSVTGQPADRHGFIGVQYLHPDGRRTVNCHDGMVSSPADPMPARPTRTPRLPTVFDELSAHGVTSTVLLNELGDLHEDVTGRLAQGARTSRLRLPSGASPHDMVRALGHQIAACIEPGSVTWAYLDLDRHVHRHGYCEQTNAAVAALNCLADQFRDAGTAVLVFSDHGLAASRPTPSTMTAWHEAASPHWCRLPGGGAGRARWLYPHPRKTSQELKCQAA